MDEIRSSQSPCQDRKNFICECELSSEVPLNSKGPTSFVKGGPKNVAVEEKLTQQQGDKKTSINKDKAIHPLKCFICGSGPYASAQRRRDICFKGVGTCYFSHTKKVLDAVIQTTTRRSFLPQWQSLQKLNRTRKSCIKPRNPLNKGYGKKYDSYAPFLNHVECYMCGNYGHKVAIWKFGKNTPPFKNKSNRSMDCVEYQKIYSHINNEKAIPK